MTTVSPSTAVPAVGTKGKAQGKGKRATATQAIKTQHQPEQQEQIARQPMYRHAIKTPPSTTSAILHPRTYRQRQITGCVKDPVESVKRVHIQLRTAFYTPHKKPWRQTLVASTKDRTKATAMRATGQTSPTKCYNTNGQDPPTSRRTQISTQTKKTDRKTEQGKQQE